ncbi:hypothetical protein, partial [Salmonella enterica]|uniref:hypothetical protein n=1 Tax=Salmonella enterica TaxID=28901 RepID=UPI003CCBADF3
TPCALISQINLGRFLTKGPHSLSRQGVVINQSANGKPEKEREKPETQMLPSGKICSEKSLIAMRGIPVLTWDSKKKPPVSLLI